MIRITIIYSSIAVNFRTMFHTKKSFILLEIFIFQLLAAATPTAVLDFDAINISSGDAYALTERFRTEIQQVDTSRIFLDRNKMQDVLKEQGFQETFCTEKECAVEIGNMLGVEEIIVGSIAKVGGTYTVNLRGIDVTSGEITHSVSRDFSVPIDNVLTSGMRDIARNYAFGDQKANVVHSPTFRNGYTVDFSNIRSVEDFEPLLDGIRSEWIAARNPVSVDYHTRIKAENDASLDQGGDWILVPGCSGFSCSYCGGIAIVAVPISSILGYYDPVLVPDRRLEKIQDEPESYRIGYIAAYKKAVKRSRLKRAMVSSLVGFIAGRIVFKVL